MPYIILGLAVLTALLALVFVVRWLFWLFLKASGGANVAWGYPVYATVLAVGSVWFWQITFSPVGVFG